MKIQRGFTLIELMIVMAIIAIIVAVAYPSYIEYLKKGRRADAQTVMMDIVNRENQYLLDARQYTTDLTTLKVSPRGWTCSATDCSNAYYTISVAVPNPDAGSLAISFKITAQAGGTQSNDGNLTVDNLGNKTSSVPNRW